MKLPGLIRQVLRWSAAAMIIISCNNDRIFENNVEFGDRTWKFSDEPMFTFAIADTTLRYNLYFNIRNTLNYPVTRINITWHLYDSTGNELTKKLEYQDLFEKTGKPLGESGLGDLYDHQFPILKKYHFRNKGNYSIKLVQFMRQDTLRGVIAVGVRVEKDSGN